MNNFEEQKKELDNHPKAIQPMSIGTKMYLEKACSLFFEQLRKEFMDVKSNVSESFAGYTKDVAKSHDDFRHAIVKELNDAIGKLDKKFGGLYGTLVNKFLNAQENKIFTIECFFQAFMEETAKELHSIKSQAASGAAGSEEEFVKQFQARVEEQMVVVRQETLNEAKKKKEAQDVAATQAPPAEAPTNEAEKAPT